LRHDGVALSFAKDCQASQPDQIRPPFSTPAALLTVSIKRDGKTNYHAAMAGTAMKKRKPPTGTGPKIGDRVRLVSEAPLRNDEMDLQGKTGEIIECTEGKRVTVRFANGRLLMGKDVALFERT